MNANPKNYFKFFIGLVLCLLVRLIPLRAPNIEPILATTMPLSKIFGAFGAFTFAVLSVLLYDVVTSTLGMQTFFTATAYGVVGLWAAHYFKTKNTNRGNYVRFAVMSTLFFDAATGLTVGPIFFNQSFLGALVGQIPFTMLHLLGNIAFAFVLSPAIYEILLKKRKREPRPIINTLNPKVI